jgi:hypothetical protein
LRILKVNQLLAVLLTVAITGVVGACTRGKGPDLLVQVCLRDEQGVASFKSALQSIAAAERMKYIDASATTARDLKVIGATDDRMHTAGGLVHVGIEGHGGVGLTAGNMGLNKYEVAIGFSNGPPDAERRKFSDVVVSELLRRWEVKVVPEGSGALPDESCKPEAPYGVAPPNKSERTREG